VTLDLSTQNSALTADVFTNIDRFSAFIDGQLATAGAKFGIGGYLEQRNVYSQSAILWKSWRTGTG
jgi:hypothetical protein